MPLTLSTTQKAKASSNNYVPYLSITYSLSGNPYTITIDDSADSFTDNIAPNNNYHSSQLQVMAPDGFILTDTQYTWLKFPLNMIPSGASITEATLYLSTHGLPNSIGTPIDAPNVTAYAGSSTWTETTITWNNQPSIGVALSSINVTAANTWYFWTVTNQIIICLPGQVSSIVLKTGTGLATFSARENLVNFVQPVFKVRGIGAIIPQLTGGGTPGYYYPGETIVVWGNQSTDTYVFDHFERQGITFSSSSSNPATFTTLTSGETFTAVFLPNTTGSITNAQLTFFNAPVLLAKNWNMDNSIGYFICGCLLSAMIILAIVIPLAFLVGRNKLAITIITLGISLLCVFFTWLNVGLFAIMLVIFFVLGGTNILTSRN